jgi:hypothetical protein
MRLVRGHTDGRDGAISSFISSRATPSHRYAANGWDTAVVTTSAGQTLITCLDPYDSEQQQQQRDLGLSIALFGTAAGKIEYHSN